MNTLATAEKTSALDAIRELLDTYFHEAEGSADEDGKFSLEKYLEAALAGWRVVRLGPKELNADHLKRLIDLIRSAPDPSLRRESA